MLEKIKIKNGEKKKKELKFRDAQNSKGFSGSSMGHGSFLGHGLMGLFAPFWFSFVKETKLKCDTVTSGLDAAWAVVIMK